MPDHACPCRGGPAGLGREPLDRFGRRHVRGVVGHRDAGGARRRRDRAGRARWSVRGRVRPRRDRDEPVPFAHPPPLRNRVRRPRPSPRDRRRRGPPRGCGHGWLEQQDPVWRAQVATVALDPHAGYRTAATDPQVGFDNARLVADCFHVVKLANAAIDDVRRRVQQATCGHRGRKHDPQRRWIGRHHARRRLRTERTPSAGADGALTSVAPSRWRGPGTDPRPAQTVIPGDPRTARGSCRPRWPHGCRAARVRRRWCHVGSAAPARR